MDEAIDHESSCSEQRTQYAEKDIKTYKSANIC